MFKRKKELTEAEKNHQRALMLNREKAEKLGLSFTNKTTTAELAEMIGKYNRRKAREAKGLI